MATNNYKGFIKDVNENIILPITRGELVLDKHGVVALNSEEFLATNGHAGLLKSDEREGLIALLGDSSENPASPIAILKQELDAINDSLSINNTKLPFYTFSEGNVTGNKYNIIGKAGAITVTSKDGSITFDLAKPTITSTAGVVITSVDVDEYGRVTNVTGANTLNNVSLNNCTAAAIDDNSGNLSVVNKQYVDDKFKTAAVTAVGALKFISALGEGDSAIINTYLERSDEGSYFKISGSFTIDKDLFVSEQSDVNVTSGDTLIVHHDDFGEKKFIYIPSGDDVPTTISFYDSANNHGVASQGSTTVLFEEPFNLTNNGNGQISIKIPLASTENDGIISSKTFNLIQTATAKTMSYNPSINQDTLGQYKIGEIGFGDSSAEPNVIYGRDTTYNLAITAKDNIPSLSFSSNVSNTPKEISLNGGNGINVSTTKSDNLYFGINLGNDNKYLKVDENGCLVANISTPPNAGNSSFTDGLIDNKVFSQFTSVLALAAYYEPISYSLLSGNPDTSADTNYKYGSSDLKTAVDITI